MERRRLPKTPVPPANHPNSQPQSRLVECGSLWFEPSTAHQEKRRSGGAFSIRMPGLSRSRWGRLACVEEPGELPREPPVPVPEIRIVAGTGTTRTIVASVKIVTASRQAPAPWLVELRTL